MSAAALAKGLSVVLLAALLSGCLSGTLQRKQLPLLHKGMTPTQVLDLVQRPPLCSLSYAGRPEVRVRVYRVVPASHSSWYLLLYEYGRLSYWGYAHEFAQTDQRGYRTFAERASRMIDQGLCDDQRVLTAR